MRVLIKQGRACNNDCTFCHASDRSRAADSLDRVQAKIDAAKAAGAHTVVLSGGEPTVRAELLHLADLVRDRGLRLGLVTNGRRLADANLVEALLARGLDYAYVSLHGSHAALHDALVGARAFEETLAGIRNLHGRVPNLAVNTVVTRSNLTDLRNLVDLLLPLPALQQKFTMPQPKGAAWDRFEDIVPSLREAADAVADAIRYGHQRASSAAPGRFGFEGFPLCLLPGLEAIHSDLRSHEIEFMSEPEDDGLVAVDDVLLTKPPLCAPCDLRARCPGIYRHYAERRGVDELRPLIPAAVHQTRRVADDLPDVQRPIESAAVREGAALEQRAWVRLTFACNNRCLFCLDRGNGHTEHRCADIVGDEILQGRRRGADRLILSGGEATTHPRFLDFVTFGKRAGFRWVQTVSNGRMFAYPKFVQRAVAAGLDEVTFSMHGHTASLHDRLVGVPGAFAQASRGIQAALAARRIVVNIDVVLNAHNVDLLPVMLATFVDWGVREFDLLHLIPFGGAWEQQNQHLFYDPADHLEALRAAFAFSKRPGIHLWLNRFPPAFAEGFEGLIQDPHKLHDEVRGRAEEYKTYLAGGPKLMCREPDRCARCYLRDYCDALDRARVLSQCESVDRLRVRLPLHAGMPQLPRAAGAQVVAASAADVISLLPRLRVETLRLHLADVASIAAELSPDGRIGGVPVVAVVVGTPEAIDAALALPGDFDIVIELGRQTADKVQGLGAYAKRLVLLQPVRDLLTDALREDVDLEAFFAGLPFSVRTEGIAPCLSGIVPQAQLESLDTDALGEGGRLDAQRFVDVYARQGFFTKSLRCKNCVQGPRCSGMHINWVRAHGYARMRPERCG